VVNFRRCERQGLNGYGFGHSGRAFSTLSFGLLASRADRVRQGSASLRSQSRRLKTLPPTGAKFGGASPAASRIPFGVRSGPSPIFRAPKTSLVQTGCPSAPNVLDSAPPFHLWAFAPLPPKNAVRVSRKGESLNSNHRPDAQTSLTERPARRARPGIAAATHVDSEPGEAVWLGCIIPGHSGDRRTWRTAVCLGGSSASDKAHASSPQQNPQANTDFP
jgi:hypothetical protein